MSNRIIFYSLDDTMSSRVILSLFQRAFSGISSLHLNESINAIGTWYRRKKLCPHKGRNFRSLFSLPFLCSADWGCFFFVRFSILHSPVTWLTRPSLGWPILIVCQFAVFSALWFWLPWQYAVCPALCTWRSTPDFYSGNRNVKVKEF